MDCNRAVHVAYMWFLHWGVEIVSAEPKHLTILCFDTTKLHKHKHKVQFDHSYDTDDIVGFVWRYAVKE